MATNVASGTMSAVAVGTAFTPEPGLFSLMVDVPGTATWSLRRSFDGGLTWATRNRDRAGGVIANQTTGLSTVMDEPESGVQYRVEVTSWTSGVVTWRLAQ